MFTISAESISFKHVEVFLVKFWKFCQTVHNESSLLNFFKFPNLTAMRSPGLFPIKSNGNEVSLCSSFQSFVHKNLIGHFRNEKWGGGMGAGGDWNNAIVSGIVTGDTICLLFAWSLATVPEVFAKVNSFQSLLVSKVANGTLIPLGTGTLSYCPLVN